MVPAWLLLGLAACRRLHLLPSLHAMVGRRARVIVRRCWLLLLLLLSIVYLLAILRVGLATWMVLLLVIKALAVGHQL